MVVVLLLFNGDSLVNFLNFFPVAMFTNMFTKERVRFLGNRPVDNQAGFCTNWLMQRIYSSIQSSVAVPICSIPVCLTISLPARHCLEMVSCYCQRLRMKEGGEFIGTLWLAGCWKSKLMASIKALRDRLWKTISLQVLRIQSIFCVFSD